MGTSASAPAGRGRTAVHPHACGDFVLYEESSGNLVGTPQRVWGLRPRLISHQGVLRYTPTRVGTSLALTTPRAWRAVHPHACGDFISRASANSRSTGTPPRVWGLRVLAWGQRRHKRYTPTRVGTSSTGTERPRTASVHPHACGDFISRASANSRSTGTPPRVWGLRSRPAGSKRTPTVHPHACGDFATRYISTPSTFGTPPRVWGLRQQRPGSARGSRYTPTRVGTSARLGCAQASGSVHPHACGDFHSTIRSSSVRYGTPPRVWGLPPS